VITIETEQVNQLYSGDGPAGNRAVQSIMGENEVHYGITFDLSAYKLKSLFEAEDLDYLDQTTLREISRMEKSCVHQRYACYTGSNAQDWESPHGYSSRHETRTGK
jgi:hypothetical protein